MLVALKRCQFIVKDYTNDVLEHELLYLFYKSPLRHFYAFADLDSTLCSEQEPEFLSPLENLTVAQGRDVHFTCTVNHLGTYKVAWIKSDTKTILAIHTHMVTLNPRLSVTHNGHNTWKLYISNVEPKDSGTYMCQINTDPMMSQTRMISSRICLKFSTEPTYLGKDQKEDHNYIFFLWAEIIRLLLPPLARTILFLLLLFELEPR
ncbi:hypothetical protein SFRURICE_020258 [Spodoptera frugiperda]|nr:hypothetical protein SFRURICE_020258 [Spodoptera frugiperda]